MESFWDPYAFFREERLPNGFNLHVAEWPNRPWAYLEIIVHVGARHDPPGLEGLAHFIEHLLASNTGQTPKKIEEFFERLGGSINQGATDYTGMRYGFLLPADPAILREGIAILGRMLIGARLTKRIEHERRAILSEYHESYASGYEYEFQQRECASVFDGTWLARHPDPLGTVETINRITRQDLQAHYDRTFLPVNMSAVLVSGLPVKTGVRLLKESAFSEGTRGVPVPRDPVLRTVPHPKEHGMHYRLKTVQKGAARGNLARYRSVAMLPCAAQPEVNNLTSSLLSKALNDSVREERGWAYSAECSSTNHGGFWQCSLSTDGLNPRRLGAMPKVVDRLIGSVATNRKAFNELRESSIRGIQMLDISGSTVASYAADCINDIGEIRTSADKLAIYDAMTFEDVEAALRWLTPDRRWTLTVEP